MHLTKLGLLTLIAASLAAVPSMTSAQAAPATEAAPPAPPPPPPPPPPAPTYQPAPAPAAPPPANYMPGSIRDPSPFTRPLMLSAMGYLPWFTGLGIGGKIAFEIPIVHNGFISILNDHISIEPSFSIATVDYDYGIDLDGYDNSLTELLPAVAGLWSFHLSDEFRVYGSIALGFGIYTGDIYNDDNINYFYVEFIAGLVYKLSENFGLRAEIGWRGLRGGIAFMF